MFNNATENVRENATMFRMFLCFCMVILLSHFKIIFKSMHDFWGFTCLNRSIAALGVDNLGSQGIDYWGPDGDVSGWGHKFQCGWDTVIVPGQSIEIPAKIAYSDSQFKNLEVYLAFTIQSNF